MLWRAPAPACPHLAPPVPSTFCYNFPNHKTLIQNRTRATLNPKNDEEITMHNNISMPKFDRRNVLLGLGGLALVNPNHPSNLARATESKRLVRLSEFPTSLDSVISVMVPRPRRSRSKKEEEEEVLTIEGIEFMGDKAVKFDVHVNDDEDDLSGPGGSEFAGSLVVLAGRKREKKVRTSLHLGIMELLESLGADGDSSIKVTLVPRYLETPITIGKIKIEYLSA